MPPTIQTAHGWFKPADGPAYQAYDINFTPTPPMQIHLATAYVNGHKIFAVAENRGTAMNDAQAIARDLIAETLD